MFPYCCWVTYGHTQAHALHDMLYAVGIETLPDMKH